MKLIKDPLQSNWIDFVYDQIQDYRSNGTCDNFQLTPHSSEDAIEWIPAAWSVISEETIFAGFRKHVVAPSEAI